MAKPKKAAETSSNVKVNNSDRKLERHKKAIAKKVANPPKVARGTARSNRRSGSMST